MRFNGQVNTKSMAEMNLRCAVIVKTRLYTSYSRAKRQLKHSEIKPNGSISRGEYIELGRGVWRAI